MVEDTAHYDAFQHLALKAGALDMVFRRNLWSRPVEESLRLVSSIHQVMATFHKNQ
jgi:hypothetical protein